jgi:hypothetical protein
MAISPVSDLVLDVARAADPQKAAATTRALNDASGVAPDFAAALDSTPSSVASLAAPARVQPYGLAGRAIKTAQTPAQKAAVGLEATMLKSFVDQMLPKDATHVFGAGVAGDVWKSMLSEHIATELAQSGKLKLASRLFETHPDLLKTHSVHKTAAATPVAPQMKIKI